MRKLTKASELTRNYCRDFKNLPDLTLAKMIYDENMGLGKDVEQIRGYVTYWRGHKGVKHRKKVKNSDTIKPITYDTNKYSPFKEQVNTSAKILVLDIETAFMMAGAWKLWKNDISIDQIESDWFILTWAAKWLFEKKVYSAKLTGKEAIKQDDKRIMGSIWEMLNQADIVITHNGNKFDIPKLNTRFILNGFPPPLPYQRIDTYEVVSKTFAFSSNKQDFLNIKFGSPRKLDTGGWQLWKDCYRGDETALAKMERYNIGDVVSLENNYLILRPWIRPHPNMGLFILDNVERCPSCGHHDLKWEGTYRTSANNYDSFRCNNCGAVGRKRTAKDNIEKRRHLTMAVAK